jgi:uncharacterized delta-60 repeat protein
MTMARKLLRSFTVALFIPSIVFAAPGDIDRTFGSNGIVITPHGSVSEVGQAVVQSDGKFVVVGANGSDFYIARLNANGGFDTTFDLDGQATIAVSPREDRAAGVFVQTDGKILICGSTRSESSTWDFAVVRLNSDGTLDNTFDNDGIKISAITSADDFADAVIAQPDGKIIVAGQSMTNQMNMIVVRYNADGSPDASFDGDGVATAQFQEGASTSSDVQLQGDGKIVVAGGTAVGSIFSLYSFGVARFNPNGTLDAGFAGDGTAFVDVRNGAAQQNSAENLLIQPDGKIVASGNTNSGFASGNDFAVLRLSANGTPDPTFGSGGKVITPIGPNDDFPKSLAIQADGKLLVGGEGRIGSSSFTLVRYNPDGRLDPLFGINGISFVRPISDGRIAALNIQPDGHIAAFGYNQFNATLVRFFQNGYVHSDFDGDGKADIGIFRPIQGASEWWINLSSTGQTTALQFGASIDRITPADYTGDGKVDIAFFQPQSGYWYVLRSEDFSFFAVPFGAFGDVPVPADFDADGKADFAVFRPTGSTWFISQSSGAPTRIQQFGSPGDYPSVADYDADGRADVAIWRPLGSTAAEWWIDRSTAGLLSMQFGTGLDKPVPGDYTGDGRADVAVWRPSTGEWFVVRSEDNSFYGFPFGAPGDVVAPGDYDGDRKFDATVFRPTSATWFVGRTTAGTQIVQFGTSGDRPVANAFIIP